MEDAAASGLPHLPATLEAYSAVAKAGGPDEFGETNQTPPQHEEEAGRGAALPLLRGVVDGGVVAHGQASGASRRCSVRTSRSTWPPSRPPSTTPVSGEDDHQEPAG